MRVEDNAVYRVKALAELLDVHRTTIYRAIESGRLGALKIGTGKGVVRVPGYAVNIWLSDCADAGYESFVQGSESSEVADSDVADVRGTGDAAGVA